MQIDVQGLLDGFEAPAIFYRENTVRYFNQSAKTLFPEISSGKPMPEGFDAPDSPFRAEANQTERGVLYLFRPKMEERSAGDLSAIIRQLRSSLAVLMMAEERIGTMLRQQQEPESDHIMEQVARNLYALRRLCDHIDMLRELESRGPEVYRERQVDLAELCTRLGDQIAGLIRTAGVSFKLDCKLPTLVTAGDKDKLQMMILNLVSNAIKAAGPGGEIGLRLEKKDGRALISVWDSGNGMEAERLASVFRPQRRRGVPKPADGAGVGLRLVREIVVLHGGLILTEARADGGTKMTASLPLRELRTEQLRAATTWEQDDLSVVLTELSDALPAQTYAHADMEG